MKFLKNFFAELPANIHTHHLQKETIQAPRCFPDNSLQTESMLHFPTIEKQSHTKSPGMNIDFDDLLHRRNCWKALGIKPWPAITSTGLTELNQLIKKTNSAISFTSCCLKKPKKKWIFRFHAKFSTETRRKTSKNLLKNHEVYFTGDS